MGRRENKQINLEGRILFDLLMVNTRLRYATRLDSASLLGPTARVQTPFLHAQCRQLPFPSAAEGGRAALDHLRSAGNLPLIWARVFISLP